MNVRESGLFLGKNEAGFEQRELSGAELFNTLKRIFKVGHVTGLPCGELREFIRASEKDKEMIHTPATNEREAVGIAAGAWLGGKQPLLYMQNSGFFEASNDVGSLIIASKIPAIFVVSWRGAPGETATQHLVTGSATKPLLSAFAIEYTDMASNENLELLKVQQEKTSLPVCILQKREKFNNPESRSVSAEKARSRVEVIREEDIPLHSREEVLSVIAQTTEQSSAVISSTGLISRSLFHYYDSPNQFYNAGALGLTSSIGLGISSAQPERKVVVIEGDGSVLTNLGNLNLIGYYQPKHFLHIVLDNQSYVSCSGESTIGSGNIPELASVLGYNKVFSVSSLETVANIIKESQCLNSGPVMLHVKINNEGSRRFRRPLEMSFIARRFRNYFQDNK